MSRIIAGHFQLQEQIDAARAALNQAGFPDSRISSFFVNQPGQHDLHELGGDRDMSPGAKETPEGIAEGAAVGAAVGAGVGAVAVAVAGPIGPATSTAAAPTPAPTAAPTAAPSATPSGVSLAPGDMSRSPPSACKSCCPGWLTKKALMRLSAKPAWSRAARAASTSSCNWK